MDEEFKDRERIAKTSNSIHKKYRVLKAGKMEEDMRWKDTLSPSSNLWNRLSKTLSAKNLIWNLIRMKRSFWEKKSQNPSEKDQIIVW